MQVAHSQQHLQMMQIHKCLEKSLKNSDFCLAALQHTTLKKSMKELSFIGSYVMVMDIFFSQGRELEK